MPSMLLSDLALNPEACGDRAVADKGSEDGHNRRYERTQGNEALLIVC